MPSAIGKRAAEPLCHLAFATATTHKFLDRNVNTRQRGGKLPLGFGHIHSENGLGMVQGKNLETKLLQSLKHRYGSLTARLR